MGLPDVSGTSRRTMGGEQNNASFFFVHVFPCSALFTSIASEWALSLFCLPILIRLGPCWVSVPISVRFCGFSASVTFITHGGFPVFDAARPLLVLCQSNPILVLFSDCHQVPVLVRFRFRFLFGSGSGSDSRSVLWIFSRCYVIHQVYKKPWTRLPLTKLLMTRTK